MIGIARGLASLFLTAGLLVLGSCGAQAETEVDLALVLAVDVSLSMEPDEQELQRQGFIDAFRSPEVHGAIRKGMLGRIAVTYVEWAGAGYQQVVVPWTVIEQPADSDAFAARLAESSIQRFGYTSISGAIDFSLQQLRQSGITPVRQMIDISGDGANNQGRIVTAARDEAVAQGITINGLPLMLNRPNFGYPEVEHLDQYYTDCVIGGPAAFTIPIRERDQFIDATRTKILLEIALGPPVGLPANVIPAQFSPSDLLKAQAKAPANCMFGERSWQQRWGN
jgi:hypothetical protein